MSGTFQEYLVHKTLRFKTEEKSVLAKYPGSNASSKFLLRSALSSGLRFDRACITWRLIKYHKSDCPEMPSFPLPSMVGSSARQVDLVVDLGQTQNVRHKRLKSDSAQAQDVRQNLDSDTVIRSVRGSVGILFERHRERGLAIPAVPHVVNPASGSAELPPPVLDAAVETAKEPKDIVLGQVLVKISAARKFLEHLELVNTECDKLLECVGTEERTLIESTLTELSDFFVAGQRAKVLAEISQEAAQGFLRLKYFEGSHGAILETQTLLNKQHRTWLSGAVGQGRHRCFRVLTTVQNVLTFIREADVSQSRRNEGAVSVRHRSPVIHLGMELYMLKEGELHLNRRLFDNVRFKSFELALNYREMSARYTLQPLAKKGATLEELDARYGRFYELLTEVIINEKKRQLNFKDSYVLLSHHCNQLMSLLRVALSETIF